MTLVNTICIVQPFQYNCAYYTIVQALTHTLAKTCLYEHTATASDLRFLF